MREVQFLSSVYAMGRQRTANERAVVPDSVAQRLIASGEAQDPRDADPLPQYVEVADLDDPDSPARINLADALEKSALRIGALPRFRQKMIWGGQAGHPYTNTGGTGSTFNLNDTSDFALGDRSIKITTDGTGQNTYVRALNAAAHDFTGMVPRIWMKVDSPHDGLDFHLWLGSGGGLANAYLWQLLDVATPPYYEAGEWFSLTLPWSQATVNGTPDRAALTDFNLQIFDRNQGAGVTVHFGGLAMVPDTTDLWPNGVVSFTFDDAYVTHYTEAKKYLDKYGWAATEYPIIEQIGLNPNYLTIDQLHRLVDESGWEVGVHSFTAAGHNQPGGITADAPDEQVREVLRSRQWIIDQGLPFPIHYAYPQGIHDSATEENLAPYVATARSTQPRTETFPPSHRMKLYTRALRNIDTLANITAFVDQAAANGEWLILTFHDVKDSSVEATHTTTAIFEGIVDYVASKGCAVRTVGEVMRTLVP